MFARTERLLLRPSWPEDAPELHAAIADEGIVRNLARAPWPYRMKDALDFASLDHGEMYPAFLLSLRTDSEPRIIGACGIGERDGAAELGYWIARPYWGLGFASEAGRAVVGIAKALGHQRLTAGHFIDNPASGRVLRKLGFTHTGRSEERYSKGRGCTMTSVLYEKLLEDSADSDVNMRHSSAADISEHLERLRAA